MAEETNTSPVSAAEPPKANPLAAPAAKTAATLQMKPVIRKPAIGGAGVALKPGLKLPPKPGVAAASPLKAVAASPLKPGLKMPAAPTLKPGIKLPTKPVIRKPGSGIAPLKPAVPAAPKPAVPVAAPAAPAAAAPTEPVKPTAPVAPVATPISAEPPKSALGALKAVTQNLKNVQVSSEVPQQAVLHKTGIIAAPVKDLTDAQKQAAKSKTARISLSEAVGVAPVKNENAPMKTIRIKRPANLQTSGPATAKPADAPVAAPVVAPVAAAPAAAAPAPAPAEKGDVSLTQRKTLKITRPSNLGVRPAGKFGINKPAAPAAPAAAAAPSAGGEVADIPDIPDMPAVSLPSVGAAGDTVADVPAVVGIIGVVVQIAACAVIGALAWFLYQDAQIPLF